MTPKRKAALLSLATELAGAKSKRVVAEVTLSVDDTPAYLEQYGDDYETLEDADAAAVPWLGLIESLNAHGRLAEVDWKELASEVLAWLEQLGGKPVRQALAAARAEGEALDERSTHEALALFGRALSARELALVALDKSSDSYALMVVPAGRVKALQKLARSAGEQIVHFTGDDLETIERERRKQLAKHASTNPWTKLVADNDYQRTGTAVDSVLWNLNHDETIEHIREVAPFAPKRDQPLIAMTLAIYDGSAARLAKTTRDGKRLLTALRYLKSAEPENRYQRFAAAAILAERLRVKGDGGTLHAAVLDACNVWNDGRATDEQLARLPAAHRDRLARLGDAMLEKARVEGNSRWDSALRMLGTCGDLASVPLLEAAGARSMALRVKHGWDLEGPFSWDEAIAHIRRRAKPRRKRAKR